MKHTVIKPAWRVLILLAVLCARLGRAQERSTRFPVSCADVVAALQRAGMLVDGAQVEMPLGLNATSDRPSLRIVAAELLSDGRLRIRISCEDLGVCQPFYINIASTSHGTELKSLVSLRSNLTDDRPARLLTKAVLRAGTRTQLYLENEHMRIVIPVVAIDSGAIGAEVRVVSLDRKQTYRVFVVSAVEVRGQLP